MYATVTTTAVTSQTRLDAHLLTAKRANSNATPLEIASVLEMYVMAFNIAATGPMRVDKRVQMASLAGCITWNAPAATNAYITLIFATVTSIAEMVQTRLDATHAFATRRTLAVTLDVVSTRRPSATAGLNA
jgi:hypothetical protein